MRQHAMKRWRHLRELGHQPTKQAGDDSICRTKMARLSAATILRRNVSEMPKVLRFLIFITISMALLADVAFIIWATQWKLLIVVPIVLSAVYLVLLAAYRTILK
jgi:hypothetical protein